MRRSPIVLAATVAGTAGVLAFHPQAPAVQTATAAATTSRPRRAARAHRRRRQRRRAARATVPAPPPATPSTRSYGTAQVRVTVKDGKIVAIEALQLQGNDPRSVQISSSAEPSCSRRR